MSCDDVDRLRAELAGSLSSAWPPEALQHLQACSRCSKLQAALDSASPAELSDALTKRIEAAILPELRPVSPMPGALHVTALLILCALGVIAVVDWRLGTAGWRARTPLQDAVDVMFLGMSLLAAAHSLAQRMMPGSGRGSSLFAIVGPCLALLLADVALIGDRWNAHALRVGLSCWGIGVACAIISAPLFWLVLRRGLFLNPLLHGAASGLLAGVTGMIVLEIHCPYLDRLHISAAHMGATLTVVLAGSAWGFLRSRYRRTV